MNQSNTVAHRVDLLLSGPRGPRFLLEYALASDRAKNLVLVEGTIDHAVGIAAHRLDPDVSGPNAIFGWVPSDGGPAVVSMSDIATLLDRVVLLDPTAELLRNALVASVDAARYWQAPDGADVLANSPEISGSLERVAFHVVRSPLTGWWWSAVDTSTQLTVRWEEEDHTFQEFASDGAANSMDAWWSAPLVLPSSTRALHDGSPAGLWFVEDSFGWERAVSRPLFVPADARVFEIRHAADWADLCARFPIDVTAQKQDHWQQVTGHAGPWVVPDWSQVAQHYAGVHLQVGAYLAAARTAIQVGIAGAASVIAGWAPDVTYWFSPDITLGTAQRRWHLDDSGPDLMWRQH